MTNADNRKCPICGNNESWSMPHEPLPVTIKVLEQMDKDVEANWRLCTKCGNGYPNFTPEQNVLAKLWSINRTDDGETDEEIKQRNKIRVEISQMGGVRALDMYGPLMPSKNGKFLDIGCGLGETVSAFQNAGFDAYGVDPDPTVKSHHEKIGIRTTTGQIEDVDLHGSFDMIQISHAIYFVTNPSDFLKRVKSLLSDNGIFAITVSDFSSWLDGSLPNYHHTFYPTPRTMRAALAIHGFNIIKEQKLKGSVYLAAVKAQPEKPDVNPMAQWLHWKTQKLRFHLIGRPVLVIGRAVKRLLKL